jgi:hypothetical protein
VSPPRARVTQGCNRRTPATCHAPCNMQQASTPSTDASRNHARRIYDHAVAPPTSSLDPHACSVQATLVCGRAPAAARRRRADELRGALPPVTQHRMNASTASCVFWPLPWPVTAAMRTTCTDAPFAGTCPWRSSAIRRSSCPVPAVCHSSTTLPCGVPVAMAVRRGCVRVGGVAGCGCRRLSSSSAGVGAALRAWRVTCQCRLALRLLGAGCARLRCCRV